MTNPGLIAVIDDDTSLRDALTGLLRSLGYETHGSGSAEDFLASDARSRAACIITDIHMPGMSGIDLKHHLAAIGSTAPVIMITGRAEPALLKRAEASGAMCILKKPFDADQLIDCVARATAPIGD